MFLIHGSSTIWSYKMNAQYQADMPRLDSDVEHLIGVPFQKYARVLVALWWWNRDYRARWREHRLHLGIIPGEIVIF